MENGLLLPILLLFLCTILVAIIKRLKRDSCLRCFHGGMCWVFSEEIKPYYGKLTVLSNSMSLQCSQTAYFSEGNQFEEVLYYDVDLLRVHLILSPAPEQSGEAYRRWRRRLKGIQNPGWCRMGLRRLRNMFNILRDAVSKALAMVIGVAKNKSRIGKIPAAGNGVDDVGNAVLESISNSYEPLLEARLGKRMGVKIKGEAGHISLVGTIEEYNTNYMLLRDIKVEAEELAALFSVKVQEGRCYDAIVSRQIGVARFSVKSD